MPEHAAVLDDAAAEIAVRSALRGHAATLRLADARLSRIAGGLSNFAWRATPAAGDACFVRLARDQGEALGADHVNEARVLGVTAPEGLSPPVICCDPAARLLVTHWIDDANPGRVLRGDRGLRPVADALARLHALEVPAGVRVVDFAHQAVELQATLREPLPTRLASCARDVFAALGQRPVRGVLCHNDLNPLNLVLDATGRPWLVDWEYAGLGDPAFDLASLASQHGLDARARGRLRLAYVAAGGQLDPARLECAAWAFDYVQCLWYRAALESAGSLADPALAAVRARRLEASLRTRASRVLRCNNAAFDG